MPRVTLGPPRRLERTDDRSTFASGATELDDWFQRFAWQNLANDNAVTYVSTTDKGVVAGYYALCTAGVSRDHVPARFATGRPRVIPCILLARLAVDERFQGLRIGRHLLRDAIARAVTASASIGASALLIHARDEAAKAFYLANADLLQSPVDEMQLLLPMRAARDALGS